MAAYLIAEHKLSEPAFFKEYLDGALPLLERYGAKFITEPGSHRVVGGGDWQPDRVVILEFPAMSALDEFLASPEYQPLVTIRQRAGPEVLFAVNGV